MDGSGHYGSIRLTAQRKLILSVVRESKKHPTAEDVFLMVRKQIPRVSLGTVYRNLESLSAAGYVRKIERSSGPKRFEADLSDHLHIRCTACDAIEDAKAIPGLKHMIEKHLQTGFHITGHDLEISGICPSCQAKQTQ